MRVLFFGSDTFSIRALNVLRKHTGISADIVTPQIKKYGRNLDKLSVPSIQTYCHHYELPFHTEIDSVIRNKINNSDYDLCVVVSYDAFITSDVLSKIPFSLNIHPSLLPKYKGSSPLQYTLLNQDTTCGVTLQNLDPVRFDSGKIVTQTVPLNVNEVLSGNLTQFEYVFNNSISKCHVQKQDKDMSFLLDSTENRIYGEKFNVFKNEMGNIGSTLFNEYLTKEMFTTSKCVAPKYKSSWAKKLQKNIAQINWETDDRKKIMNNLQVLKNLFTFKKQFSKKSKNMKNENLETQQDIQLKRVIFSDLKNFDLVEKVPVEFQKAKAGGFYPFLESSKEKVLIKCINNEYLICDALQFESFQPEDGAKWLRNLNKRCNNRNTLGDIEQMYFE